MNLPSLHGPLPLRLVAVWDSATKSRRFEWWPTGLLIRQDESAFVPMTFPEPLPDYTPEEMAKMQAAESRRIAKRERAA